MINSDAIFVFARRNGFSIICIGTRWPVQSWESQKNSQNSQKRRVVAWAQSPLSWAGLCSRTDRNDFAFTPRRTTTTSTFSSRWCLSVSACQSVCHEPPFHSLVRKKNVAILPRIYHIHIVIHSSIIVIVAMIIATFIVNQSSNVKRNTVVVDNSSTRMPSWRYFITSRQVSAVSLIFPATCPTSCRWRKSRRDELSYARRRTVFRVFFLRQQAAWVYSGIMEFCHDSKSCRFYLSEFIWGRKYV